MLSDKEPDVRLATIEALDAMPEVAIDQVPKIMDLLTPGENPSIKSTAIRVLIAMKNPILSRSCILQRCLTIKILMSGSRRASK